MTITELFTEYVNIVNDDYSTDEDFARSDVIESELMAIGGDNLLWHLNRHQAADRFGRDYTGISIGSPYVDYSPNHSYLLTKAGKMHGQSQRAFKIRLQKRLAKRLESN